MSGEYLLTVKEAAELLAIGERAVRKNAMAGRYGELAFVDGARGGKSGRMTMIRLAALPEAVQSAYLRQHNIIEEPERPVASVYDRADADARATANERYRTLKEYEAYIATPGKRTELTRAFLRDWNAAHPDAQLSQSTLYNWQAKHRADGLSGLLPQYGKRKGERRIDAPAWEFFQVQYLQQSRPSVGDCYILLARKAKVEGWTIPSRATIARMVKEDIPEAVRTLRRFGDKKYMDDIQTFTRRDPESIRAGEVFVGDHHILDVFINVGTIEKPKWARPWMTAWLDMRSRKFVGWTVNLSPCTDEIIAAFANAALDPAIGLPRHIYIDNGRDYCSAKFAGRGHRGNPLTEEDKEALIAEGKMARSLMDRLDIKTHWAIVENARAKVIERAFKEVVERFSKAFPLYCGRNQDERPDVLEERMKNPKKYAMNLTEFRAIFDDWIRTVFNKTVSQGAGRAGECPDETYMRTRLPVRTADADVMRLYFMRSTNPFRIGRNGITFRKAEYYHPDMALLKGKRVYIRYRNEDPERIWLYDTDDRYLGEAERISALPAIAASAEELDAEQARKARERKAVVAHPSYQAAKSAQPLTPADITELYRVCGGNAADVRPSKVVELVALPKTGKESVQAMQATGTDDVNPFAIMAKAKIEKRRKP
ncbi:DNA-binding domain-containing protein [uncultured Selenomonas sp.]|uniref:DNA-binding domain-containing protein n=1 Tax=uncultured Selenomonas sp. TaxID=159275 RepID=UPI002598A14C|nr:DNA-binding domain-containing protein [uncultured Selenomonas sp.]